MKKTDILIKIKKLDEISKDLYQNLYELVQAEIEQNMNIIQLISEYKIDKPEIRFNNEEIVEYFESHHKI